MNLPHGGVGVRVGHNRIEIYHTRQVRRWWFWKRWRTDVLASAHYAIKTNDIVRLEQFGPGRYVATINDQPVLRYPQPGKWF